MFVPQWKTTAPAGRLIPETDDDNYYDDDDYESDEPNEDLRDEKQSTEAAGILGELLKEDNHYTITPPVATKSLNDSFRRRKNILPNNNEEENSSRNCSATNNNDAAVFDKNKNYLQKLAESKKAAKEEEEGKAVAKEKNRLRLKKSVLQRARAAKEQKVPVPETTVPSKNSTAENNVMSEEEEVQRLLLEKKKRKSQAKLLREKQNQVLEKLKATKALKLEAEELERQKAERLRAATKESALKNLKEPSSNLIPAAGSAVSAIRERKKATAVEAPPELTPEEKEQRKAQTAALRQKQQEAMQKLVEKRRQADAAEAEKAERQAKLVAKARQKAQLHLKDAEKKAQAAAKEREESEKAAEAAEAAVVKPVVNVSAMVSRLSRISERDTQSVPEARDFASWKKRNGLSPDTKVFAITGWYPVIKAALEDRGWFHNTDRESPFFDLIWALKSDNLKSLKLKENQFVNHFMSNTAITTKVGLLHNLRNLSWYDNIDLDTFFPRAYDLNDDTHMQAFQDDFKSIEAEKVLKSLECLSQQIVNGETQLEVNVNAGVLQTVFEVCRKRQEILPDEMLDDQCPLSTGVEALVTDLQWEVLSNCDISKCTGTISAEEPEHVPVIEENSTTASERKKHRRAAKKRHKKAQQKRSDMVQLLTTLRAFSLEDATEVLSIIDGLRDVCPQYNLNGATPSNVWIVKPAGMSRGRGIRVFNDLRPLLTYTDVENHKECQWVVQKYIENPLLIGKRKFDIRQWVLVTSWNPLTVWFFNDCYLRFCVEEFSLADLSDQFVHLANNSISKHSEKFDQVYSNDDGEGGFKVEGNMWHSDDFKTYLKKKHGNERSVWKDQIQKAMKDIVVSSLKCVQDTIVQRKNACELYGYDFMIDEDYKPWLIEVNSSPACDYSTKVAERHVTEGLEGIVKVIVDNNRDFNGGGGSADAGGWEKIYKGDHVPLPIAAFGTEFVIKGDKVLKRRASSCAINSKATVVDKELRESATTKTIEQPKPPVASSVTIQAQKKAQRASSMIAMKPSIVQPSFVPEYDPDPLL